MYWVSAYWDRLVQDMSHQYLLYDLSVESVAGDSAALPQGSLLTLVNLPCTCLCLH